MLGLEMALGSEVGLALGMQRGRSTSRTQKRGSKICLELVEARKEESGGLRSRVHGIHGMSV